MSEFRIETQCVQGCYKPGNGEPRVLPICQSTTYKYDSSEHLGDLFDLKAPGHMYSRISNPTVEMVEKKIAMLEGGVGAALVSSGQAANLCRAELRQPFFNLWRYNQFVRCYTEEDGD